MQKVKMMYALYAYIHYIIMLLAYFIFWSRGDKISVHNNQRGIQFHYIIIEEEQISVHRNQGGYKISVHRNQGGSKLDCTELRGGAKLQCTAINHP